MKVFINPEILALMPTYLKRKEADMELLRNSIQIQDFESIKNVGHKLHGSGAMYGLAWISDAGKDLELATIVKDMKKIKKISQELCDYLENLEIFPQGET